MGKESSGRIPWEVLVLGACVALCLVPVWSFEFFPTQDGPSHLHNARVLLSYFAEDAAVLREYYEIRWLPLPTWLGHGMLAVLMTVLSPLLAERVLVSVYVILLPLSVRYALRSLSVKSGFLAILVCPFIYNYLLFMGFYGFALSLPIYFFVLGYWWRHADSHSWRSALVLAGATITLYFAHPSTLVASWLAIASIEAGRRLGAVSTAGGRATPWWKALATIRLRRLEFLALLPAGGLLLWFVATTEGGGLTTGLRWKLEYLLTLRTLSVFGAGETWLALGVAALFLYLIIYALVKKPVTQSGEAAFAFVMAVVLLGLAYFGIETSANKVIFIHDRLGLLIPLTLLLWFGSYTYKRGPRLLIQGGAFGLTLALLAARLPYQARISELLQQYTSTAALIEPNSTLLALSFSGWNRALPTTGERLRIAVFEHAAGYVAADRPVVLLNNYEANRDYFPVRFRASLNPYDFIGLHGSHAKEPGEIDFGSYPERTGGRVDYVLLWGPLPEEEVGSGPSLARQLSEGFELIYSAEDGWLRLYRGRRLGAVSAVGSPQRGWHDTCQS